MAVLSIVLLYIGALSSIGLVSASESSVCPDQSSVLLYNLYSQCPLEISPNPPLQVDGNFLDKVLATNKRNSFTSVLFYASWCPFSHYIRPKFDMLGSMFPQIEHYAIEESAALPSIFSRYGIHSLPTILMVNKTSKMQYHGPKNIQALVQFYENITGIKPIVHLAEDESTTSDIIEESIMQPWIGSSLEEMMKREPYLVFAILFLTLRVLLYIAPKVLSHLKAFYGLYIPHFNVEIFGETSQLFGRILHMIDVRRVWTKLRLCKTRNFHQSAKNCRVWASSLASVSLGKSSSSAR
ncbi:5'-adenylylsulfate reductase-like 7 [Mercurialis annua]|uniref:5'-adenylylsulfate reductase-like 7 n=1 Tax=Mercurialis annua TaxID=3986 RepID=UPI00215F4852|nr:5'-adenylylsulfate reductase-like 7 [Mercurialis annua]